MFNHMFQLRRVQSASARSGGRQMFKTILQANDGSEPGFKALSVALAIAKQNDFRTPHGFGRGDFVSTELGRGSSRGKGKGGPSFPHCVAARPGNGGRTASGASHPRPSGPPGTGRREASRRSGRRLANHRCDGALGAVRANDRQPRGSDHPTFTLSGPRGEITMAGICLGSFGLIFILLYASA
jgi:hypothetical protein